MTKQYDVVVVGAGAAGLSGALALARSRRSVLVIDAGDPRNASAGHVHNFLTRDGATPAELYAAGRREVEGYGGQVISGRVEALTRDGELFGVSYDGGAVAARRLLVATGSRDELPAVPGLAARWGLDVLHCAYCHGWEVRDQRVAVLATGPLAVHQALMFAQLTRHVVLLEHTGPQPTPEQAEQLHALGIPVAVGTVVALDADDDGLAAVRLHDGTRVGLDALVVAPVSRARAELLAPLGLQTSEVRMSDQLLGTQVDADATGATAVAGVWVAGNVASVQAQLVGSAAAGLAAAAAVNSDLVVADAVRARHRHTCAPGNGQQGWNDRYRERPQTWSGKPNAALVAEVADLAPGSAFDAGAGEGGDALWLAARGWRVTAADLSTVALERAERAARAAGLDIDWRHLDLTRDPVPGSYDLVTASYLHLPAEPRRVLFERLADAVAPGGTLLIIGHHPSDAHTAMPRPALAETGWTAEELASSLGEGWVIDTCATPPRTASGPDGRQVTISDAVVRAHRPASEAR